MKCRPVQPEEIVNLLPQIEEMEALLAERDDAVGLAAPQVGFDFQAFAMKTILEDPDGGDPKVWTNVFINPEIKEYVGSPARKKEACLSVPGVSVEIPRWNAVKMAWTDRAGQINLELIEGFRAQIVQHEISHLRGALCIDAAGFTARRRAIKQYFAQQEAK